MLNVFLASIEAEDIELGATNEDLALDVDEAVAEEDPEALDTDDEDSEENAQLGIDTEESDGQYRHHRASPVIESTRRTHAHRAIIFVTSQ
jgi:hypothetical protein